MRVLALALGLLASGGAALAEAPEAAQRPLAREVPDPAGDEAAPPPAPATLRPRLRPSGDDSRAPPEADEPSPLAVAEALLPQARPSRVVAKAEQVRVALVRGQVCGDPAIQGEQVAAIRDGGGCGIEAPVSVRSVDGVALSEPALMDCETAQALLDWVREGARPAVGGRGGGLHGLTVMGSYTCRSRNNQAGTRLSEHGKGHAIDIGAVTLADGSRIDVLRDWPDPALREMRDAACGTFSTVLGPGSDRFHDNHLHLDTARGRGPYCR